MKRPTVARTARTVLVAAVAVGWLCLSMGPARVAAQADKADHVKVTATADKPDADGKQVIAVTLELDPGWHVYANPAGYDLFEPEATKLKASIDGKPVELKIDYPRGKLIESTDINFRVYEKKVTIKGTLQRAKGDTRPVKVKVGFQPCNDKGQCLSHVDVEREVQ
jgi:DsbC/DsbD-like thiol-disulfide interchange protein